MRKIPRNSKLWEYLNRTGVLEHGTSDDIAIAKKEFRKIYLSTYKKQSRTKKSEHTISLTPAERSIIEKNRSEQTLTLATLIKKSALAYLTQKPFFPYTQELAKVSQKLTEIELNIERIASKERGIFSMKRDYEIVIHEVENVHKLFVEKIQTSMNVTEIVIKYLQENPSAKQELQKLIEQCS